MNAFNRSLYLAICLVVASTALSNCKTMQNVESAKMKLIGGEEIAEHQWPSVRKLKIYVKESTGAFSLKSECTMTFVKPNVALTAAHCLCHGDRFVYSEKERWDDFISFKKLIHPKYICSNKSPNAFDVGLVWFDEKVAMPTSKIIGQNPEESLNRIRLIGYGKNILKITGSFWMGTRQPVTESSQPSPRKGETEFDGKHMGEATWRGDQSIDLGFIRLKATYDVKSEINEPMTESSSAVGDSGGPAFTLKSNEILGVMSRGGHQFTGIASEKVEVITELIDLRRKDIRDFLKEHGVMDQVAAE